MGETLRKNPWLGLESYKEGEILYGRDDDIRDLSQCVLNDTNTLLYGKSGIGKSSILNAGILPAARRYGYLPVLIRLSHKEKDSYLYQINQAIINAILVSKNSASRNILPSNDVENINIDISSLKHEIVPCKNIESESIYEYFHRHTFHDVNGERLKLLIIFDQFEEIFTLQENVQKKKRFFAHLADMLNDVMPDELQHKMDVISDTQEEINVVEDVNLEHIFDNLDLDIENDLPEYVSDNEIHFVFTIREDFLSEFEYYSATIPSLKQNRYGLRPINEEQAAQIILRPVPGLIDESVAKLIIENITGKKDFSLDGIPEIEVDSAVLSLYLKQLYSESDGNLISKYLVEQKGGEIISKFYHDALSCVSHSTIKYLEDMLLNGQGRRDNITVYDAINDGKISEEELEILCDEKKILRKFNHGGDLRIEYIHDILCPIVNENKTSRIIKAEKELQNRKFKKSRRNVLIVLGFISLLAILAISFAIRETNNSRKLDIMLKEKTEEKKKADEERVKALKANADLSMANDQIQNKNKLLENARDSLFMQNKLLENARDSMSMQNKLIDNARDSLSSRNKQLELLNEKFKQINTQLNGMNQQLKKEQHNNEELNKALYKYLDELKNIYLQLGDTLNMKRIESVSIEVKSSSFEISMIDDRIEVLKNANENVIIEHQNPIYKAAKHRLDRLNLKLSELNAQLAEEF